MKLPGLPKFGKKENSETFLALVFQDEKINSFIFEKVPQKITILAQHEEYFESSIDETDIEELVNLTDKAISYAEEKIGKDLGVLKTIFGVKQNWISEDKIKQEYLDKLKKLSDDLGLTPIGFLTTGDAIVNQIQKEEGAPPSAVLADIGKKYVTVSLVKVGKIVESKTSEIHQSPVFTVDTLLKHLTIPEILPAKVYFIGEEELSQEFIGHQWSKSLPFLHLPQIINLPEQFVANAFVSGVAKEMRAQVVVGEKEQTTPVPPFKAPPETAEPKPEGIEYVDNAASLFGFAKDEDIAKKPKDNFQTVSTAQPQEEIKTRGKKFALPAPTAILPFLKGVFSQSKTAISKLNIKSFSPAALRERKKFLLLGLIPVFLILFLAWYIFGLKAEVVLGVKSETKEMSQKVLFSSSQPSDFDNNIITSQKVEAKESGSITRAVTGKKETGDKAKGTVTIFNSTDSTVTFPAKTTITSSNKLSFITLDKVTVASQSGASDPFATKTPGKANVNVESVEFGPEQNLPSGTKFTIGSNALIAAKNDNPFSGGTKREITIVSENDIEKIQEELIKSLQEKARDQILAKVAEDSDILQGFTSTELTDESFDKEEGDEAKQLTLKATVSFLTLSYKKKDMLDYSTFLFDSESSEINKNNLEVSFKDIDSVSEDEAEVLLELKAKILPKLQKEDLISKIKGKSFSEAENILLSITDVEKVSFKFIPNIGFLPKVLPRVSENITIRIADDG